MDGEEEGERCSICFEWFRDANTSAAPAAPDSTVEIGCACGVRFHLSCISRWLGEATSCPHCRITPAVSSPLFVDFARRSAQMSAMIVERQLGAAVERDAGLGYTRSAMFEALMVFCYSVSIVSGAPLHQLPMFLGSSIVLGGGSRVIYRAHWRTRLVFAASIFLLCTAAMAVLLDSGSPPSYAFSLIALHLYVHEFRGTFARSLRGIVS